MNETEKKDYGFTIKCDSNLKDIEETLNRIIILVEKLNSMKISFNIGYKEK